MARKHRRKFYMIKTILKSGTENGQSSMPIWHQILHLFAVPIIVIVLHLVMVFLVATKISSSFEQSVTMIITMLDGIIRS